MYSAHKKKMVGKKSEGGFVLIVALMGIMILLAVGYFALTISTSDLRIASHLVGERKAFSAAESGVHVFCQKFDSMSLNTINGFVDATNDPTVRYTSADSVRNSEQPLLSVAGYDLTQSYAGASYDTVITGEDTAYGSKTQIEIGTVSAPNPSDTQQGRN